MEDYIDEYLKRSFHEHESQIPIPKYIDFFFTFTEFGRYLHQYFRRFTRIEYILGLDPISLSYIIKKKISRKNISCLAAANKLSDLVNNFLDPHKNSSWTKKTFGYGTSVNYAKMLKMAKEENPSLSEDQIKEQIKFMVEFSKKILEMEKELTQSVNGMDYNGLRNTYNADSIEGLIGYTKLNQLLNETTPQAQAATAPDEDASEAHEGAHEDVDRPLLQRGGSRRHTRRRRHRHSLRSRKLIKRPKKGKKIMKQPTKNRRVNIRKQNNKKTKSRK